jgi:hypothetical protein
MYGLLNFLSILTVFCGERKSFDRKTKKTSLYESWELQPAPIQKRGYFRVLSDD